MGSMTGNKTIDLALVGLLTLASLATLGVFVYTEMVFEKPLPDEKTEKSALLEDSGKLVAPEVYKLDKLIININATGSRLRFLDVETHLVPYKSKALETFDNQKAFIIDAIIDIASNMPAEELNTVSGKVLLEERIRTRLNDFFGKVLIKEIFFSRFVVQ